MKCVGGVFWTQIVAFTDQSYLIFTFGFKLISPLALINFQSWISREKQDASTVVANFYLRVKDLEQDKPINSIQ